MRRFAPWILGLFMLVLLTAGVARAGETVTQEFKHNLIINQPAQSWEHRIDLPADCGNHGFIFVKRELQLDGRLVIEREELTPTYYYVKVKLPKHLEEPVAGILVVKLSVDKQQALVPVLDAPTGLKLMEGCASRRPAFLWNGAKKYSVISLYDVNTNQTIWERVIVKHTGAAYDEPNYIELHHYKWAVMQSDETGRWSKETQAGFRVEQQPNGSVIAIPE
ncbi:MAG: hypothetical protein WA705_22280 [Candidatus Ozemobacteraceae bacterium]